MTLEENYILLSVSYIGIVIHGSSYQKKLTNLSCFLPSRDLAIMESSLLRNGEGIPLTIVLASYGNTAMLIQELL